MEQYLFVCRSPRGTFVLSKPAEGSSFEVALSELPFVLSRQNCKVVIESTTIPSLCGLHESTKEAHADPSCEMKIVDIFCGIGGFSAGALAAGCRPVLGVDIVSAFAKLWSSNTGADARCTDFWENKVKLAADSTTHIHLSPPCTHISRANSVASTREKEHSFSCIRNAVSFALSHNCSWSLETVSTTITRKLASEIKDTDPRVDWINLDAADYGVPSNRIRIIMSSPGLVKRLSETPVDRVSVSEAFRRVGIIPAANYIRNSTRTLKGTMCPRSIEIASHTQTASHPLTWCGKHGETVRCLNVQETAIIQGFHSSWKLPRTSRQAIRALGNAVPPPLARAIMVAAISARHEIPT